MEAMPELYNRVDGADGALTRTRNKPSSTRRSGGRDESASHMTAELCACARAMEYRPVEKGDEAEALLQTLNTALQRAPSPAINA
jgi:hypothetical protein